MNSETKIIDVQVDEARALAQLESEINKKFVGAPKDLKVWFRLVDELKAKAAEIGFIVEITPHISPKGNWIPVCDIVGRTDRHLDAILQEQGPDVERKMWDAQRVSAEELEAQGIDTNLLG